MVSIVSDMSPNAVIVVSCLFFSLVFFCCCYLFVCFFWFWIYFVVVVVVVVVFIQERFKREKPSGLQLTKFSRAAVGRKSCLSKHVVHYASMNFDLNTRILSFSVVYSRIVLL